MTSDVAQDGKRKEGIQPYLYLPERACFYGRVERKEQECGKLRFLNRKLGRFIFLRISVVPIACDHDERK
jgi:hypothetical protein